jgi:exopolysaccharide production protein ExoQ
VGAGIALTDTAELRRTDVRGIAFAVGLFFSFRLCIVLVSTRLLGLEPSTGSALTLSLDLLLFGLVCFDSVGASQRTLGSMLRLPAVRWAMLYLAFSGASLLWTDSASLLNSIAYWVGLVVDVGSVMFLLRSGSGTDECYLVMKGFVCSTCFLALLAWMMPTASDLRLGDEQFFPTNEIANTCAFAVFFAQYLTRQNQGKWSFAKFFLVITLVRTLSKATLVAFLVSESILLIMDRSMRRRTKVILLTSAIVLIFAFWGLFEAYYEVYTTAGNQAETFTGRTAIWLFALAGVTDHPWSLWIGHGFDSWWKVVPPFGSGMFEARHAENEFLQQLYAYGVAGVVLLVGIYRSLYRQLRGLQRCPTKILFLSFLTYIIVRGLAEAGPFDLLLPLWSVIVIGFLIDQARTPEQDASKIQGLHRASSAMNPRDLSIADGGSAI